MSLDCLKEVEFKKKGENCHKTVQLHQESTQSHKSTIVLAKLHELSFQLVSQPHFLRIWHCTTFPVCKLEIQAQLHKILV